MFETVTNHFPSMTWSTMDVRSLDAHAWTTAGCTLTSVQLLHAIPTWGAFHIWSWPYCFTTAKTECHDNSLDELVWYHESRSAFWEGCSIDFCTHCLWDTSSLMACLRFGSDRFFLAKVLSRWYPCSHSQPQEVIHHMNCTKLAHHAHSLTPLQLEMALLG